MFNCQKKIVKLANQQVVLIREKQHLLVPCEMGVVLQGKTNVSAFVVIVLIVNLDFDDAFGVPAEREAHLKEMCTLFQKFNM